MKWYTIVYTNNYNLSRSHTFSGNIGVVRMVMEAYKIDLGSVTEFTINDEAVDLRRYLGGEV